MMTSSLTSSFIMTIGIMMMILFFSSSSIIPYCAVVQVQVQVVEGFQSIQKVQQRRNYVAVTTPTTTTITSSSRSSRSSKPSSSSSSSLLRMTTTKDEDTNTNTNINTNENEDTDTPKSKDLTFLDAILWDMDGVLAETERDAHRIAFNTVFTERNLNTEWTIELYGTLLEVGGGKERMTHYWNTVGWPESICDDTTSSRQEKVQELHSAKTEIFNDIISQGTVPLRPGVERVMDEAHQNNIQLAVCSTSNEKAVRNLVTTLLGPERASKFNNAIFAGDIVPNKKPAPDIYNLAVQTLKLDKTRCVIVEDSSIGFHAALASGICCIVTKSVYTKNENFDGADLIVTDLDGSDGFSDQVTLHTIEELLAKRLSKTT